jgi:hypothetical protein
VNRAWFWAPVRSDVLLSDSPPDVATSDLSDIHVKAKKIAASRKVKKDRSNSDEKKIRGVANDK